MKRLLRLFLFIFALGIGGELLSARTAEASPTCIVREFEGDEHNGFYCYAIGADNQLWRISYDETNDGWDADWRLLRGGPGLQGAISCVGAAAQDRDAPPPPVDFSPGDDTRPAALGVPQDSFRCYTRGLDGAVQQHSVPSPAWTSLGGTFAGAPDCATGGSTQCFARAADNSLSRNYTNLRGEWVGWQSLGGVAMSDPECVGSHLRVDCFVRNANNGLSHIACLNRQPCAQWATLDGTFSGNPSCASSTTGPRRTLARIDCFVRGTDNTVFQKTYTGTWSPWRRVGTRAVFGDPECIEMGATRNVCFARNAGGYLISATREGDTWSEWTLAGNIALSGQPSCIFRPVYNDAHCAARGVSGRLVHTHMIFGAPTTTTEVGAFMIHD